MNRILFVAVYVSDQDRALDFYERLGFQKSSDNVGHPSDAGDPDGNTIVVVQPQ